MTGLSLPYDPGCGYKLGDFLTVPPQQKDLLDGRIDTVRRRDVDVHAVGVVVAGLRGAERGVIRVDQDHLVLGRVARAPIAQPSM